jgi:hypothetical protein
MCFRSVRSPGERQPPVVTRVLRPITSDIFSQVTTVCYSVLQIFTMKLSAGFSNGSLLLGFSRRISRERTHAHDPFIVICSDPLFQLAIGLAGHPLFQLAIGLAGHPLFQLAIGLAGHPLFQLAIGLAGHPLFQLAIGLAGHPLFQLAIGLAGLHLLHNKKKC